MNRVFDRTMEGPIRSEDGNHRGGLTFILSRTLRTKLKELSGKANPDGQKVVRWTDFLERGVAKLTDADLVTLRAMREEILRENQSL